MFNLFKALSSQSFSTKLSLIVPSTNLGSCGEYIKFLRYHFSANCPTSISSMKNLPLVKSKIPDNAFMSVDFPDPLLPTITAISPGLILRFKLSKIGFFCSGY